LQALATLLPTAAFKASFRMPIARLLASALLSKAAFGSCSLQPTTTVAAGVSIASVRCFMMSRFDVSTPAAYGPHDEETRLIAFSSECLLPTAKESSS
jgi:hypothetical protein